MPLGIGIGLSLTRGQGVGAPRFSRPIVAILIGDSQPFGTLNTGEQATAVAAYTVTDKVKVGQTSNGTAVSWTTYTPGTACGIEAGSNSGNVGMEIGFINAFRAAYPNDTLYLIKETQSGSYQTRGASTGAANITSAGNNTYTVNSGTVGGQTLVVGSGIETGVYVPFGLFLANVGLAGGRSGAAFGPVAITKYAGNLSWSSTEGLTYNGNSAQIDNGMRARGLALLALLTNPLVVAFNYCIGTNDALASLGANHATDLDNFYTRLNANFPLTNAVWNFIRPALNGGGAATVRSNIATKAATDPTKMKVIDMDAQNRWDGTHWDLTGVTFAGAQCFANTVFP